MERFNALLYVHGLLTKIHDIPDSAGSKFICNTALIFCTPFNSASRQHYDVWASQFPFHHNSKDNIPPNESCLYGCINWSLAQTQHQSSIGLSQSSTPMIGSRPDVKLVSSLM